MYRQVYINIVGKDVGVVEKRTNIVGREENYKKWKRLKKRQRKKIQQSSGWKRKERAVYLKQAKESGSMTIADSK